MDTSIKNLKIETLEKSNFIKPFRLKFENFGVPAQWDCVRVHDSVSILLYHREFEAFLLVKQLRPALWYHENLEGKNYDEMGICYELCAGLMDKNKSPKQTAIEEVFEETGYEVADLESVNSFFGAVGFAASKAQFFYAEIDESMKKGPGGGIDGEKIEICFVKKDEILDFLKDEKKAKTTGLAFAFMWYLNSH